MKFFNWVSGFGIALSIVVVLAVTLVQFVAFDTNWYKEEYEKYGIYDELNMETGELNKVTETMVGYLQGDVENLEVSAIVDGETREFFNDREKEHMADVKVLFEKLLLVRNAALFLFMICGIYYLFAMRAGMRLFDYTPIPCAIVGILLVIAMAVVMIMSKTNFSSAFTSFHEMLFTNDLWLLNPETDLLIRMLPEGFFMDTAMKMGLYLLILGAAAICAFPVLIYFKFTYDECTAEAEANFEKQGYGKIKVRNL